nr:hypothetical protein [uncultured Draconibacterium sp.]
MQYPDTITITRKPEYTQDANLNFKTVGEGTPFTNECRAEVAGSDPTIPGADGKKVEYSWIVYMPKQTEKFDYGCKLELTLADGSVYKSSLKQQKNGQFNTRLWV